MGKCITCGVLEGLMQENIAKKCAALITKLRAGRGKTKMTLTDIAKMVAEQNGGNPDIGMVFRVQTNTDSCHEEEVLPIWSVLSKEFGENGERIQSDRKCIRGKTEDDQWAREIAERIKHKMASMGLTVQDAADLTGVSGTYLKSIVDGNKFHRPSIMVYAKIAKGFVISLDYLIYGKDDDVSHISSIMAEEISTLSESNRFILSSTIEAMRNAQKYSMC